MANSADVALVVNLFEYSTVEGPMKNSTTLYFMLLFALLVATTAAGCADSTRRGRILDRHGAVLAFSKAVTVAGAPDRHYPLGEDAAHVVGYVGRTKPGAIHWVGRSAVERSFDGPLAAGRDVQLTIDGSLQVHAAKALRNVKAGAVVIVDAQSGAVRALASAPTYEPGVMSGRLSSTQWATLRKNMLAPLQHRAVQPYTPGHMFTPLLAATRLHSGTLTAQHRSHCTGYVVHNNRNFRCGATHGKLDVKSAIAEQCSSYFFKLAQRTTHDHDPWMSALGIFGLGKPTGVEIGEHLGRLPDKAWYGANSRFGWQDGLKLSSAIGQGAILVTPLQVARAMSILINGGNDVSLRLDRQPHSTQPIVSLLPARSTAPVIEALERLSSKTLAGIRASPEEAQWTHRGNDAHRRWLLQHHSWFAGYLRANPRIVIVVFVEHAGDHTAASQIAEGLALEIKTLATTEKP